MDQITDSLPKSVLFVIGSLNKGGAESQLAMLADGLAKRGVDVSIFCLESGGVLQKRIEESGCRVVSGGFHTAGNRLKRILLLARAFWRLILHTRRYRPDVLHAYLPLTNFMGAVAGHIGGVPLVITARRALGSHQDRHPLWPPMDRIVNRLSHRVTVNSQAVADDTMRRDGITAEKMVLIHNGINVAAFQPDSEKRDEIRSQLKLGNTDIAIVTVANLIPYKGHAELIEAFSEVSRRHPSCKLFLAGEDRGIGENLKQMVTHHGIIDKVFFLGRQDDMPALLNAMDLAVLASHEEGFSNAVMEKLSAGLPVVATSVGGNPEALEGMPGCYLCPPKDPASLQRGLETCIDNLLGDGPYRSRRIAMMDQRYSVEKMVKHHLRIYSRD